jgi:hypothetical protein
VSAASATAAAGAEPPPRAAGGGSPGKPRALPGSKSSPHDGPREHHETHAEAERRQRAAYDSRYGLLTSMQTLLDAPTPGNWQAMVLFDAI